MKIVVSHLTRMEHPFICVAGIDVATGKHVRPVLETGRLGRSLLTRHGGPFDMAVVVDLGSVWTVGQAPEFEDHRFDRRRVRRVQTYAPPAFWECLVRASRSHLADIFGDELERQGGTFAVPFHKGVASLGCLAPAAPPVLMVNAYDKVRIRIFDGTQEAWLTVTDLRLYGEDQTTPRRDAVQHLKTRIDSGVPVLLSVGLTRPFLKPGDSVERHWLQVNNIHLQDDPTWQDNLSG